MVKQTSLESWRKLQPDLSRKQREMLAVFKKYALLRFTDKELAKILRWPINSVTPRRGELADKGLIHEAGVVWDKGTRRHVTTWRLRKH